MDNSKTQLPGDKGVEALKRVRENTISFIQEMNNESSQPKAYRNTEAVNPQQVAYGAQHILKDICLTLDQLDPRPQGSWYDQSHLQRLP